MSSTKISLKFMRAIRERSDIGRANSRSEPHHPIHEQPTASLVTWGHSSSTLSSITIRFRSNTPTIEASRHRSLSHSSLRNIFRNLFIRLSSESSSQASVLKPREVFSPGICCVTPPELARGYRHPQRQTVGNGITALPGYSRHLSSEPSVQVDDRHPLRNTHHLPMKN